MNKVNGPAAPGRDRGIVKKTAALVVSLVVFIGTGTVANAATWIVPQSFANNIDAHGVVLTTTNRTFRDPEDGGWRPEQVLQFASLTALKAEIAAGTIPAGTTVMYDLEAWMFSPADELARPYRSMRRFVMAARADHLVAALAPGGALRDRAARLDCDLFMAQIQNVIDPASYRVAVRRIADRLHPGTQMIAQLSANDRGGHTTAGLYAQWRAARRYSDGFSLWYGNGENLVQTASDFLALVAATPDLVWP
jgi:hypothetical protein